MSDSDTPPVDAKQEAAKAHAKKLKDKVATVRSGLRITKVIATRAIRTRNGDFFCGMSAAWNTVQDPSDGEIVSDADIAPSGMTLDDSKIAHILLSMEVAIGAYRAALAEGAITEEEFNNRTKQVKRNTLAHLQRIMPPDEARAQIENAEAA